MASCLCTGTLRPDTSASAGNQLTGTLPESWALDDFFDNLRGLYLGSNQARTTACGCSHITMRGQAWPALQGHSRLPGAYALRRRSMRSLVMLARSLHCWIAARQVPRAAQAPGAVHCPPPLRRRVTGAKRHSCALLRSCLG